MNTERAATSRERKGETTMFGFYGSNEPLKAETISSFVAEAYAEGIDIQDYAKIGCNLYEVWGVDEDGDDFKAKVEVKL